MAGHLNDDLPFDRLDWRVLMSRHLNGKTVFYLFLVALNTVYMSQLVHLDRPFAAGEPGPAFLPMILCGFVYFALIRLLLLEIKAAPTSKEYPDTNSTGIQHFSVIGPVAAIVLTGLFITGFVYLGYVVSTLAYTFMMSLLFNLEQTRQWKRSIVVATVTSAGVTITGWLFFEKLFDLYLPTWGF
jgi:hypothetical protein